MDFEFIRPAILWLLLPALGLFFIVMLKKKKAQSAPLITPHLAQFVMSESNNQARQPLWLVALFCSLAIIFSAGPSFEEKQVPVFQSKSARVIVMDMSYSMYSTDIAPNRLMQSRFKALDMIELFKEGDTALVAYAGTAYTISPLTNDATTLANLIPSLSPEIMPDKGSNVLAGLDMAQELLTQAGYLDGDIILITDGIEQQQQSDISGFTNSSQYRLNIYGIGTEQGAPIKLPEGGFLKDNYGQIVVPTLNGSLLKGIAKNSGGQYANYQPSNSDIAIFSPQANSEILKSEKPNLALWRIDAGIYGLLILLPLALYLFRRSAFIGAVLLLSFLPQQNAHAVELPTLFKNTDQRALEAYNNQEYQQAAQAKSNALKGAALYQQGQFEGALNEFSQDKSATGYYNYGNALAKAGQLEAAINAYKQAQSLQSDFTQAADNQALVEQLLKQQQQQQQDQENQQGNDSQNQDDQSQDDADKSKQDQQKNGDKNNADKSEDNSQNSEEQQSGEPSEQSKDQQSQSGEQSDKQNQPDMQAQSQNQQDENKDENKDDDSKPQQDEQQSQPNQMNEQPPSDEQKQQAQQQAMQAQAAELTNEEKEKAQQLNQLLRKVPDDPAILLRNKMQLEAQKRQYQRRPTGVEKSW